MREDGYAVERRSRVIGFDTEVGGFAEERLDDLHAPVVTLTAREHVQIHRIELDSRHVIGHRRERHDLTVRLHAPVAGTE